MRRATRYESEMLAPTAARLRFLYTILAVLFIFVGRLAAMVVEAGLGREIEWVGTHLPVAAPLGMFVRTFAAFGVCVLLLWIASQGQGGCSGPLLSVSQV